MFECVCMSATVLFHYIAAPVLPGSDPRRFRHPSGLGVRWRTEEEAGVRGVCVEGRGLDLLVTINIKLLYKAPVDNIKGPAEQNKQSGFIKKGLGGVGRRQR